MNYTSFLVGLSSFAVIGVFHPIVIKGEYYFSKKIWPLFLVCGVLLLAAALKVQQQLISSILSISGFACLWSIKELHEQERRVRRGWFPENPRRSEKETRGLKAGDNNI